jgi:CheY-like chemotaxis protein
MRLRASLNRGAQCLPLSARMTPLYILLADDEAEIRRLMTRWLEREGHYVTCAANGLEATAIAQAKEFDLVVTDVLMPESDGVEFITQLKKIRPRARVLAMSGGGRVMQGADCLRMAQGLGAHAVVMKPFTREQFLAAVTQALGPQPAPKLAAK